MNKTLNAFNKILSGLLLGIILTGTAFAAQAGIENGIAYFKHSISEIPTTATVVGTSISTDSSIEVWTDGLPTNYGVEVIAEGGTVTQETTPANVHSDTSSALITGPNAGAGVGAIITQPNTGLTPGTMYRTEAWGKCGTATKVTMTYINSTSYATATEIYDINANEWVVLGGPVKTETIADSGTWSNSGTDYLVVPASGIITIVVLTEGTELTPNSTGWVDDITLKPVTRPTTQTEVVGAQIYAITKDLILTDATQGVIPLYTVPVGYKMMVIGAYIESQSSDTINTAGEYSIGTNSPTYDNIITTTDFPTITGYKDNIENSSQNYIAQEGDTIYYKLTTEWDADEAIGTIYLLGVLIEI